MQVVPVQGAPTPAQGPRAFIAAVGKDRKAPGLKALGLDKEPGVAALLGNKDIALPFKAIRSLPVAGGWLLLVGSGDPKLLTQEKIGTLANMGCRAAAAVGCRAAVTTLVLDTWKDAAAAQAVAHGAVIGALDFDQWKSKPAEYKPADTKARELKQEPPSPPVKLETLEVLAPTLVARLLEGVHFLPVKLSNKSPSFVRTPLTSQSGEKLFFVELVSFGIYRIKNSENVKTFCEAILSEMLPFAK